MQYINVNPGATAVADMSRIDIDNIVKGVGHDMTQNGMLQLWERPPAKFKGISDWHIPQTMADKVLCSGGTDHKTANLVTETENAEDPQENPKVPEAVVKTLYNHIKKILENTACSSKMCATVRKQHLVDMFPEIPVEKALSVLLKDKKIEMLDDGKFLKKTYTKTYTVAPASP